MAVKDLIYIGAVTPKLLGEPYDRLLLRLKLILDQFSYKDSSHNVFCVYMSGMQDEYIDERIMRGKVR